MLSPEDYRQLAERCVLLAGECAAPSVAAALRTLALDYLTSAVSLAAGPKPRHLMPRHPIVDFADDTMPGRRRTESHRPQSR